MGKKVILIPLLTILKKPTLFLSTFLLLGLSFTKHVTAFQTPNPLIKNIFNKNNDVTPNPQQQPPPTPPPPQQQQPSTLQVVGMYAIGPILPAVVLPILTDQFRLTQDPFALLTVLIAKRGFMYLLAILATAYAGWRAASSSSFFQRPAGESLDALNREILRGEPPTPYYADSNESKTSKQEMTKKEDKVKREDEVFAALDEQENVGETLAIALPLFLTAALSISYVLLQGDTADVSATLVGGSSFDWKEIVNSVSFLSNFMVCLLFSAAEYRSTSTSDETLVESNDYDDDNDNFLERVVTIPNAIAFGTVLAAFFLPLSQAWPFQNSINIAIAVTVTRALAPFINNGEKGSIRTIALALTGLSVYDICSVFGTSLFTVQAASAAIDAIDVGDVNNLGDSVSEIVDTTMNVGAIASINSDYGEIETSTSNIILADESSVMETVARAKLQGPWRPGLLEMVLVGRVSDAIGLGDIVFPACLVAWGFAQEMTYAYAAIGGYVLGSFLTELASTLGPSSIVGQGLPALIFITPAMLGSVSLVALLKGEVDTVWGEKENNDK